MIKVMDPGILDWTRKEAEPGGHLKNEKKLKDHCVSFLSEAKV